jgi:hypothetical protein
LLHTPPKQYRSGHLTRISIDPVTGHFDHPAPPAKDVLQLPSNPTGSPRARRFEVRQDSAHAHQIIPIPGDSDKEEYLVCDLGSDKIYVVTYTEGDGWKIVSCYETIAGYGPRHAVIKSVSGTEEGPVVYIVNELASIVTTHRILRGDGPTRLSPPIFPDQSTLPSKKLDLKSYTPEGPMETIACAILLTPSEDQLIVTNRNLPTEISPELDPWVSFDLDPASGQILASEKTEAARWTFGAGRHLRGIGLEGLRDRKQGGKRLLIASREGDGFTLYEQKGEGAAGWEESARGLLKEEKTIEFPLAVDWL